GELTVCGQSSRRGKCDNARSVWRQRDGIKCCGSAGEPLACSGGAALLLADDREPYAVGGLRNLKLQRLTGLQRNLRKHVDRLSADRNSHLIAAEDLQ